MLQIINIATNIIKNAKFYSFNILDVLDHLWPTLKFYSSSALSNHRISQLKKSVINLKKIVVSGLPHLATSVLDR